jgi:hypothetical protein
MSLARRVLDLDQEAGDDAERVCCAAQKTLACAESNGFCNLFRRDQTFSDNLLPLHGVDEFTGAGAPFREHLERDGKRHVNRFREFSNRSHLSLAQVAPNKHPIGLCRTDKLATTRG